MLSVSVNLFLSAVSWIPLRNVRLREDLKDYVIQLTCVSFSELSGVHCSSTSSTAPVNFWFLAASEARYWSRTGIPRFLISLSVKEFTISIIHIGRFCCQSLVRSWNILSAYGAIPWRYSPSLSFNHIGIIFLMYLKCLYRRRYILRGNTSLRSPPLGNIWHLQRALTVGLLVKSSSKYTYWLALNAALLLVGMKSHTLV